MRGAGGNPSPYRDLWQGARHDCETRLLELLRGKRQAPGYQTLSNHLGHHFASWFAFLSEATVSATNWEAEQAIRPAVVNRKVWGGNRTEAGARAQGILSSVIQTCKKQAQATLGFISQTLRSFGNRLLPRPILLPSR